MLDKVNKFLGREKHTPATYDAAGHKTRQAEEELRGALRNEDARKMLGPQEYLEWVGEINRRAESMMSKWRTIYERGIGEAHDLNKKHKNLMEEARAALENLARFEIDELGIPDDLRARKEKVAGKLVE